MIFKNFRIRCLIRIALLVLTLGLTVYLILNTQLYATTLIMSVLVLYQVYNLIRFVETTNRNLSRFLSSIRYSDFSQSFTSTTRGTTFEELNQAFNDVIREFKRTRTEKEEHFQYLQTIVQHVGVGLLAFTPAGHVELFNNAAKRLLRIPHLPTIQHMESHHPRLMQKLLKIAPGERILAKTSDREDEIQLSVAATEFVMHRQQYILVSIQNIQTELEEKELESWQNLIRVLTHEIMNSITPITSLASTANSLLKQELDESHACDDEVVRDVRTAVTTIEKRSAGLLNFVQNYRRLTRLPMPEREVIKVKDLVDRVVHLMSEQIDALNVSLQVAVHPAPLELDVDPGQIEQVLINLVKNALEAVSGTSEPAVFIAAKMDITGRPLIAVSDNGSGISPEIISKIFIPFFTTKGEGSGIGLSLSRQIMRLHKGSLTVRSRIGENTVFLMRF